MPWGMSSEGGRECQCPCILRHTAFYEFKACFFQFLLEIICNDALYSGYYDLGCEA